jgi:hypothetical protein
MPKKKTSSVKSKKESSLKKGYLVKEQEAFHKAHPNAEMLIKVFLVTFILFLFLYFYKFSSMSY